MVDKTDRVRKYTTRNRPRKFERCPHDFITNVFCAYCGVKLYQDGIVDIHQLQVIRRFKIPAKTVRAYPFKWLIFCEAELRRRVINASKEMPRLYKHPFAHLP